MEGMTPLRRERGSETGLLERADGTLTGRPAGAALVRVANAAAIKAEAKECIFVRIVGVSGETVGCLRQSDKRRQEVNEEYQLVEGII